METFRSGCFSISDSSFSNAFASFTTNCFVIEEVAKLNTSFALRKPPYLHPYYMRIPLELQEEIIDSDNPSLTVGWNPSVRKTTARAFTSLLKASCFVLERFSQGCYSLHSFNRICADGELLPAATVKKYLIVQTEDEQKNADVFVKQPSYTEGEDQCVQHFSQISYIIRDILCSADRSNCVTRLCSACHLLEPAKNLIKQLFNVGTHTTENSNALARGEFSSFDVRQWVNIL